jgi:hypothetical protein
MKINEKFLYVYRQQAKQLSQLRQLSIRFNWMKIILIH